MASELDERIMAKSDLELLQILLRDAAQYRPEVLEIAEREAGARGLVLELPAGAPVEPELEDVEQPAAGTVYFAAGRVITCPHCAGTRFFLRQALLNTRALTFLNLDWLNAGSLTLTCVSCSRIEWFARVDARSG